jgi:hypothetical protein
MKKFITLRTDNGQKVRVNLDSWGGGVDRLYRRWMREPDRWHCVDTGEAAHHTGLLFSRPIKRLGPGRPV